MNELPIEVVRAELASLGIDTGAAVQKVLAAVRKHAAAAGRADPNHSNETTAAKFRAELNAGEHGTEGTRESLERCAKMLDTYAPDLFPANEKGQIHFARAMMEGAADEMRAYAANVARLLGEFHSAVSDVARRIGPAARPEYIRERLEAVLNETKFRLGG